MKHQELLAALRDTGILAGFFDMPDQELAEAIDVLSFVLVGAKNVRYLRHLHQSTATARTTSSEVAA